jgi:hypothetical protein
VQIKNYHKSNQYYNAESKITKPMFRLTFLVTGNKTPDFLRNARDGGICPVGAEIRIMISHEVLHQYEGITIYIDAEDYSIRSYWASWPCPACRGYSSEELQPGVFYHDLESRITTSQSPAPASILRST